MAHIIDEGQRLLELFERARRGEGGGQSLPLDLVESLASESRSDHQPSFSRLDQEESDLSSRDDLTTGDTTCDVCESCSLFI